MRHEMTAHELARILLELEDLTVKVYTPNGYWITPRSVEQFADTIDINID